MKRASMSTEAIRQAQEQDPARDPEGNPGLADLLGHTAEELAREYIRLMEAAPREEGVEVNPQNPERR